MNLERAIDAVLLAHQRGGRVLNRDSAEALVLLVAVALGMKMKHTETRPSAYQNGDVRE